MSLLKSRNCDFWDFKNSKKICDHKAVFDKTKGLAEIVQPIPALGGARILRARNIPKFGFLGFQKFWKNLKP